MSDFIHVNGASPVKEYDPGDAYVQFVAEPGRDSVTVSSGAEDGAVIKVGGEEKNAPFTVGLKKTPSDLRYAFRVLRGSG